MTTDLGSEPVCPRCQIPMHSDGVCIMYDEVQEGMSDFVGDDYAITMTPRSSGKRYQCWKCRGCGHSRLGNAADREV